MSIKISPLGQPIDPSTNERSLVNLYEFSHGDSDVSELTKVHVNAETDYPLDWRIFRFHQAVMFATGCHDHYLKKEAWMNPHVYALQNPEKLAVEFVVYAIRLDSQCMIIGGGGIKGRSRNEALTLAAVKVQILDEILTNYLNSGLIELKNGVLSGKLYIPKNEMKKYDKINF